MSRMKAINNSYNLANTQSFIYDNMLTIIWSERERTYMGTFKKVKKTKLSQHNKWRPTFLLCYDKSAKFLLRGAVIIQKM